MDDLDTPDELALRSLLLGVVHRSISHYAEARAFLLDVANHKVEANWISALALFELSVLRLKEAEAVDTAAGDTPATGLRSGQAKALWKEVLKEAEEMLDRACETLVSADLSSRIDTRISLLRNEIMLKQTQVLGE